MNPSPSSEEQHPDSPLVAPFFDEEVDRSTDDESDSQSELGTLESSPQDACSDKDNQAPESLVPTMGMEFASVDEAFKFYNAYALKIGFSVRKNLVRKNKTKVITMNCFTCNREGHPRERSATQPAPKYQRSELRIGCQAHMKINICSKGIYTVTSFEPEHNHVTTTPTKTKMLKSHREISKAQQAMGELADSAGLQPKQTYELLAKQVGGRRHLTFIPDDYKNYLRTQRKRDMELGDAGALMQYLQDRQKADPSFYSAIQLDNDDQITNIFWADGRSLLDYQYFGDVVCFDTTYKTNEYGRPFAIFVGVNHHKQTVIFGAALLYDESAPSFEWLFKALLDATGGKAPKVILTDQDAAMNTAIKNALPNTFHRLCVWHMYQNAAKHLSHVFSGSTSSKKDFNHCVYDCDEEEDFQCAWDNILKNYNLSDNKWLAGLFALRKKWAFVYGRQVFCADMKSTQRSESINSVIKKYLDPKKRLLDFFNHWERLLEDRRHAELVADSRASQGNPKGLYSDMLRHAASVYTPSVYKVFEAEYGRFLNCSIKDMGESENVHEYTVTNRSKDHIVRYDLSADNLTCTCLKFEFVGIQCCHVLKVLDFMNIKKLPEKYFLKRWQKNAKSGRKVHIPDIEIDPAVHMANRYSLLMQTFNGVFSTASQTDNACKYALQIAKELMSKVEELVSQDNQNFQKENSQSTRTETPHVTSEGTSRKPTGIRKKERERGRRRIPGSLESSKKRKKKGEPVNPSHPESTGMPLSSNPAIIAPTFPQNFVPEGAQAFGSATELLNVIHTLGTGSIQQSFGAKY